ncbi:MAG TPA: thiosulfate oxidation carrier complex protein SoxZ [Gammaproteobacteria bacterium]
MAKKSIRIRAEIKGDVTEVKALMSHEMETGLRTDKKTGEKIPPHFIKEVVCEHSGKQVLLANWSVAVSKNPYLSFKFKGAKKGESVKVSWTDNKGDTDTDEETIK